MPKFPDPTKHYNPPSSSSADPSTSPPPPPSSPPPSPPPSSSPSSPPPTPPLPPKKSPFASFLPFILGAVIFLALIFLLLKVVIPALKPSSSSRSSSSPASSTKNQPKTTLIYWGLWEPKSVMEPIITAYEKQHPNVKIEYKMQSPKNYRTRLQTAIQEGNAPDIVRLHNTWLPMMQSFLSPAPSDIISPADLEDFYPVFLHDFVPNNQVYGLPLMIDGLALYYNVDLFNQANLTPPQDWNELRQTAYQLTTRNPQTKLIERAGIAMGTTGNIPHWSDILGLLMLQNSADPAKPDSQEVQDALIFYTIFSRQDGIWDESQPNAIHAFATGSVAMIFAPSWQAYQIRQLNPDLNFKIIPAPTLPDTRIAWATYWVEAVPRSSRHQQEAWKFLKYLSSPEVLQKLYHQQSLLRGYGEPYPRKSMAHLLEDDPINSAFVQQAPYYRSWYLADLTHDNGLNDQLIQYYRDAVNGLNQGKSLSALIDTLSQGVQQVLSKYSLTTP